ncbi:hypothetical protein [Elongatibacter sediminis]|uniref:Alginate export domain-containing protein n=1 Tax=Elongatibacter sediminis TaxID=3119006 RepID=A0AAW9RJB2_9GAMM
MTRTRHTGPGNLAATLLALWLWPVSGPAQSMPQPGQAVADPVLEPVAVTASRRPLPQGADACDRTRGITGLPRTTQETLRSWSCHSFRWFDSLFGSRHEFDASRVNGMMTLGAEYTEYRDFDPRLRLRVRAPLPNLSSRWDLLLGRVDEDSYVRDTQPQDETFYNPGLVPREDAEWLLGLGHRRKNALKGWDYSAGVRLRTPPRPYAKAQYFHNHTFSPRTDLRFRQTFFWRGDEGFGTTSRGDLAHALDYHSVLRWEGVATVSEERDGMFWYAGQTWYRLMANSSAISLLAFIRGETHDEVPLQEYGLNLIWRRPLDGEWLYLSLGPSLTWPKFREEEKRKASFGFGAWIEIQFGDYRY